MTRNSGDAPSPLSRIGRTCARHPWWVIGVWVVLVVGLQVGAEYFGGTYTDDFTLPNTSAQTGSDLLTAHSATASGTAAQLVFRVTTGTIADHRPAVDSTIENVAKLPHVNSVSNPFASSATVSANGQIAYATIHFDENPTRLNSSYVTSVDDAATPATTQHVTVSYGGALGQAARPQPADVRSEGIGFLVAIGTLLLIFGSAAAAAFPILNAIAGVAAGLGVLGLIAANITFASVSPTLAAMIGIGVGIDYALFLTTRFRQNVIDGANPVTAAGRTVATSGRAVITAATTVVIALLGLYASGVGFLGNLGLAAGITVVVCALSALTLVPALLGLAGRRIDRLRVRTAVAEPSGAGDGWYRYAAGIGRHPWRYVTCGVVLLLVLAVPLLSIRLGHVDAGADPSDYSDRIAYDAISTGFGVGANGPLTIVVKLGPSAEGGTAAFSAAATSALTATTGVASVTPIQRTADGALLIATVIPKTSPSDPKTEALINRLTDDTLPGVLKGTGAAAYVTGATAAQLAFTSVISSRLFLVIVVVVLAAFFILLTAFRSPLIAFKAAILNLLSIGAAYGVIVAVFQWGWGGSALGVHGTVPIESYVPMMMFAIIFGLSMDYEVFLLSRIRESWLETHNNHVSVATGLAATGRVISAAAIIMTCVFLAFLLSTNVVIKMLALGLGVSVIIDATVVRLVVVPAAMYLFRTANWSVPGWLDRILPRREAEEHFGMGADRC